MTLGWRAIVLALAMALPGMSLADTESCKSNAPQEALKLQDWQRDCLPRMSSRDLTVQLFELRQASVKAQPLRAVLFAELGRRGAISDTDWRSMLAGHISSGDWEAARRLIAEPAAPEAMRQRRLPREVSRDPRLAQRASAWAFDFEKLRLRQVALTIEQGPRIIFQFATGCPFCPRAAQAIQSDERLSRLFKRCGALLAPVDGNFDLADFGRWQDKYSFLPALLVTDWSWLDEGAPRSFPSFLFLNDGKLVETIRGWPPEGRAAELLQALKNIDPAGRCSG